METLLSFEYQPYINGLFLVLIIALTYRIKRLENEKK